MKSLKRFFSVFLACLLIFGTFTFAIAATVPADPSNVRTNKTLYKYGEYISIFWDESAGATDYWVNIYDTASGEKAHSVRNANYTSLSLNPKTLPEGDYRLVVLAGNAEGYSAGNNEVFFTVYNSVPKAPTGFAAKAPLFSTSENVSLKWNKVSSADRYVITFPGESEVQLGDVKEYSHSPLAAGTYTVSLNAGNDLGFSEAVTCTFTVYDTAPAAPAALKSSKTVYSNYESVSLTWTAVFNATEYAYSLAKDGENVISDKTAGSSISLEPLTPGSYTFSVKSINAIGESEAVSVDFTVYLEEYTLSYDLNGGTGNFAPQSGNKTYIIHSDAPVKEGFVFAGWSNPESPITALLNPGNSITLSKDTTLVAIWNELPPTPVTPATISFTNSSPSSFNYGDVVIMKVDCTNAPDGSKIVWEATSGVSISASADGKSCRVTSTSSATATVTAKLVNADGTPVKNADGSEVSVSRQIKSNAGFFQKIISFFKNLFSIDRIIAQAIFG